MGHGVPQPGDARGAPIPRAPEGFGETLPSGVKTQSPGSVDREAPRDSADTQAESPPGGGARARPTTGHSGSSWACSAQRPGPGAAVRFRHGQRNQKRLQQDPLIAPKKTVPGDSPEGPGGPGGRPVRTPAPLGRHRPSGSLYTAGRSVGASRWHFRG